MKPRSLFAMLTVCTVLLGGCAGMQTAGRPPICSGALVPPGNGQTTHQALLDAALEQCQLSQKRWEEGDTDAALAALDTAYDLVLRIPSDADQSVLRQREDLRHVIAQRIIKVNSSRFNAANGTHKAIPLVMNEYVAGALESFKTRERNLFLDAYSRSGRYRPMILKALREEGMPEELSWLPLIESGFRVDACSPARALGMWQFIASTGYKFGLERNEWIDERLSPEKSTLAALAYLKELHTIFGDWSTALAAYNCGENTVLKAIKAQKVNYLDNFWDLYRRLPCETASFYPRFLAVLHIIADPARHGFTLPPLEQGVAVEQVEIDRQVHLQTIADAVGVSFALIKELNPELRKDVTPPGPYVLKVPEKTGNHLIAQLADIPLWSPPVPGYKVHKVRQGDTLSGIAAKYHTTAKAILAMNDINEDRPLVQGTKIKIPAGKSSGPASAKEPVLSSVLKENISEYVVQEGDTIWDIAERYNTTVKTIQALNQLNGTELKAGQVLAVTENPSSLQRLKTLKYTVQKGDSPSTIAKKHGMKLHDFLKLNKLSKNASLMPGDTLLVKVR